MHAIIKMAITSRIELLELLRRHLIEVNRFMKVKKEVILLISVLIMMGSFIFFGMTVWRGEQKAEEQRPITLTIIHDNTTEAAERSAHSSVFRLMLDKYTSRHPGVIIEEITLGNRELLEKYPVLIAADELPDIVYIRYPWLSEMVEDDMLADLTDYIDPMKSRQYADGLYSAQYNGRYYGLSCNYNMYNVLCYNKSILEAEGYTMAPSSFEELLELGEKLRKKGIDMISFGNQDMWPAVSCLLSPFLYGYCGKEWVNDMLDGRADWTDPGFLHALEALKQITPYINSDCNIRDDTWAAEWYIRGNTAAYISGSWALNLLYSIQEVNQDVFDATRVDLFPPTIQGQRYGCFAVACGYGVNSRCKGKRFDAALGLCQQLCGLEYAYTMLGNSTPTQVRIPTSFPERGIQFSGLSRILYGDSIKVFDPYSYSQRDIIMPLAKVVQGILESSMTPEDAVTSLIKSIPVEES